MSLDECDRLLLLHDGRARQGLEQLQNLGTCGEAAAGEWLSRVTRIGGIDGSALNTLDLVEPLSLDYARRALDRALGATLRSQSIRLLTPEDFVVFKMLSTRDKDLDDDASVLASLATELDRERIDAEILVLQAEVPDHPVAQRWRRVRGA